MPSSPRPKSKRAGESYHHGDLRQSLIQEAIALIDEAGIARLSLREVARRLGVSHNAPYRHFADKEGLLAAVAVDGFQALTSVMLAAKQSQPADTTQPLEAIGKAYIHFALTHPSHYQIMFLGGSWDDPDKYPDLGMAGQQAFEVLVGTIEAGQAIGLYRGFDALDMARVAWSLVHGQSLLLLDQSLRIKPQDLDAFLQLSATLLIQGLAQSDRQH